MMLDQLGSDCLALDGLAGHDLSAITGRSLAFNGRRIPGHNNGGAGAEQTSC